MAYLTKTEGERQRWGEDRAEKVRKERGGSEGERGRQKG